MTDEFDALEERYARFVAERDWNGHHTPENLSMSIAIEAAELMELLQWQDNPDPEQVKTDTELMERIEDEIADVMIYCISLGVCLDIDLLAAISEKMDRNEIRFDPE